MTTGRYLALALAGLLALTYLLIPHATPDADRHQRVSDALRSLFLNDAALQRDVLKARAGLLRNYDPLNQTVENLRRAVEALRSDAGVEDGNMNADIGRYVDLVDTAVTDQEALVETFKSRNALLQNSLTYFGRTIQKLEFADHQPNPLSTEVGKLANAMLRLTGDPGGDNTRDVMVSLHRLARWPNGQTTPSIRMLVAHGRLMLATLPALDESVSRLLAATITERARALQRVHDEAHARAVARASAFGILLYVVALALAAYVAYLFLRLRANARSLRERLHMERVIAAISAPFINLPRNSIDDGINDGIARLARHVGADRARVIVPVADETRVGEDYLWCGPKDSAPSGDLDGLLRLATHWPFEKYERQGWVHIPDVEALPDSPEKSRVEEDGIRSWLCMPMWCAGKRVGFLTLDNVSSPKEWSDDDIAFTRAVAEILANAIEHQRSELDRQQLEARLHQAQRLESIGTLAGGIAHEFNNVLGAIFGYAELTLSSLRRGSRAEGHVRNILTAGERAQAVINKILAFSRRSERRPGQVLAERAVAEAVDLLRASLPSTVTIETTLNAGNATVLADPTELQQVVMNLCTNGAHAMKNHGTLHVELDAVDLTDDLELSHGTLSAGRYVRLAVKDTGSGIDAATLERILEPFFTTKAAGQGTGLGLSTVHGIVTQHGGALNVRSSPGEGSTFQAYIQRAGEATAEQQSPAPRFVVRGHGETVLIVDDDGALVPLAEEMLASLGYEAVGFNRSSAALEAFRAAPNRFDLVLTDDIMPEMTGTELAGALHEIRPSVPIILMTGGGRAIRSHRLQAAGILEVLKKPLLSAAIADALARHLPSRSALTGESRN